MRIRKSITKLIMGERLPRWDGVLDIPTPYQTVRITRNKFGIPTIRADRQSDAWFALGFCQGQDRAFQLELYKRQANGELSEIFGEETLSADRLVRVIGLSRIAKEYMKVIDPEVLTLIQAFVDGINFGRNKGTQKIAHEFSILGFSPTPFQPQDIIAIQLLLAFSLTHWLPKMTRLKILMDSSAEDVIRLDPDYAAWNFLIDPVGEKAGEQMNILLNDLMEAQKTLNKSGISNNWIISAEKTINKNPILANDPHLAAELPAPWYLANMDVNQQHLSGACYPGSPLFLAGFNDHTAWGITVSFVENIDLFLEKMNGQCEVLRGNTYQPCQRIVEKIKIKEKPDHLEEVILTSHGPIITPLYLTELPTMSLYASWMKAKPIAGFFKIFDAKNIQEIRTCFSQWPLMSLNLLAVDDTNDFCWQVVGEIPQRKKTNGNLPMPGWDSAYDWEEDCYPYKWNPCSINPKSGFIATANNKPIKDGMGIYLGRDYVDGYRHVRIVKMIQDSDQKIDIGTTLHMQRDQYCSPWHDMRDRVTGSKIRSDIGKMALSLLRSWDGFVSANSSAATLYEFFISEMSKQILDETSCAGSKWAQFPFLAGIGSSNFGMRRISQIVELINQQPKDWFKGRWDVTIAESLENAWRRCVELFGSDPEKWKWGNVRPLELNHFVSGLKNNPKAKLFTEIYNSTPMFHGGDEQCVSVAAGDMQDPLILPNFIPNLRMIVEIGNWKNNTFSLAGGISGNPFSKHYDDLLRLWETGERFSILDESTIENEIKLVLNN